MTCAPLDLRRRPSYPAADGTRDPVAEHAFDATATHRQFGAPLLLADSDVTRQRLAGLVEWDAVTGADELALATPLDPARIDQDSVAAAVWPPVPHDGTD